MAIGGADREGGTLAKLEDGSYPGAEFTAMAEAALTRPEDRKLFGLAVLRMRRKLARHPT